MPIYFGADVDAKIAEFNSTTDVQEKNKLFDSIRPALVKLIESQMYLYRFYTIDDPETLKNECLSNLYEILPKFDFSKGKKAFSYFNVVTKNWFIGRIREKNRRLKQQAENFYGIDHEIVKNDPSLVSASFEDKAIESEFWLCLYRDFEKWRPLLKKKQEIQVLDAIVFLLQNPSMVSIYNKKAVFFYIKDMTNLTTKQVNHNMNRLKELYTSFHERFHSGKEEDDRE